MLQILGNRVERYKVKQSVLVAISMLLSSPEVLRGISSACSSRALSHSSAIQKDTYRKYRALPSCVQCVHTTYTYQFTLHLNVFNVTNFYTVDFTKANILYKRHYTKYVDRSGLQTEEHVSASNTSRQQPFFYTNYGYLTGDPVLSQPPPNRVHRR